MRRRRLAGTGSIVGPPFLMGDVRRYAGDIYNGSSASLLHMRNDVLHHAGVAQRTYGETAPPILGR